MLVISVIIEAQSSGETILRIDVYKRQGAPWLLYGIGAVLAIILTLCKIPALAFALGMFIPLELNVPLLSLIHILADCFRETRQQVRNVVTLPTSAYSQLIFYFLGFKHWRSNASL